MLCVLAKLSDDATNKLTAIRNSAFSDDQEVLPLHGHITLVSYEGNDAAGFIRSCKELLEGIRSFDIRYESIELFTDPFIIVAKPGKSATLDHMHKLISDEFNEALNKWTKRGCWNPHTSLYAVPGPDSQGIFLKMSEAFVPFTASVCRIEFSLVLENGYEIIDFLDLPSV